MTITAIKTVPGMGRSLVDHDEQNLHWLTRGVLHADDAPLITRTMRRGAAYNQHDTSECVAQTAKGKVNTAPLSAVLDYDVRSAYSTTEWYGGAQNNDEWSGREPTYFGTSMRGQCRYLMSIGVLLEYRWALGINDVLRTLSNGYPVGVGLVWLSGMLRPDERGLITDTGTEVGGHETELFGIDVREDEVIGMNSWGTEWGDRGRFRMKFDALDRRLSDGGDACVFTRLATG